MSDKIFEEAFARVRARYSEEQWLALSPRQITDAIYREIRQIDAARMQGNPPPSPDPDPAPDPDKE